MARVFVSYARETATEAMRVERALAEAGFETWRDEQLLPHRPFSKVIEEELSGAEAVLVLWSQPAVGSTWVNGEAAFAMDQDKLVQASLDGALPGIPFNQFHCADLSGWTGEADHPSWRRILLSLADLAGKPAPEVGSLPTTAGGSRRLGKPRLNLLLGAVLMALVTLSGILGWRFLPQVLQPTRSTTAVAISRFESDGSSEPEARVLEGRLRTLLSANGLEPVALEQRGCAASGASRRTPARLRLCGSVSRRGRLVEVSLLDNPTDTLIWSDSFGPAQDVGHQSSAAPTEIVDAVLSAYDLIADGSNRPSPQSLRRYTLAAHAMGDADSSIQRNLRDVVREQPGLAAAHAMLSLALVNESRKPQPQDSVDQLLTEAAREADNAIRMNPARSGAAYQARYMIWRARRPMDLMGAERVLNDGLRQAPDHPGLLQARCDFLLMVGRIGAARQPCREAQASRRDDPDLARGEIARTYAQGDALSTDRALVDVEQALALQPGRLALNRLRFEILVFGAPAAEAERQLADVARRPRMIPDATYAAVLPFVRARLAPSPTAFGSALTSAREAWNARLLDGRTFIQIATVTGHLDDAFAVLDELPYPADLETHPLFRPPAAPLRADPRFWRFADRTGLSAYWRGTGQWPDFCGSRCPDLAQTARATPPR